MILGVVLALAAECDLDAAVASVRDVGDQAAYLCLANANGGDTRLRAAIPENAGNAERLTRAMSIWLLQHADAPFPVEDVSLLRAPDKRLLADGVRARRGRKTPVAEHAAVFEQFEWYRPLANYTDGTLRPVDRGNLASLSMVGASTPAVAPAPTEKTPEEVRQIATLIVPGVLILAGVVGGVVLVRRARSR